MDIRIICLGVGSNKRDEGINLIENILNNPNASAPLMKGKIIKSYLLSNSFF